MDRVQVSPKTKFLHSIDAAQRAAVIVAGRTVVHRGFLLSRHAPHGAEQGEFFEVTGLAEVFEHCIPRFSAQAAEVGAAETDFVVVAVRGVIDVDVTRQFH